MWKYAHWNLIVKIVITIFFAIALIGSFNKTPQTITSQQSVITPTVEQLKQQQVNNYVFDVPSLVDKDLDGVIAVLGTPKGIDPTAKQIELGAKEWDKTFVKDGKELLVTYTISDKKIIDFFISTDDPSGTTTNTAHLLEMGNVKQDDSRYQIEFVKAIKNPSSYTGIKIIPN